MVFPPLLKASQKTNGKLVCTGHILQVTMTPLSQDHVTKVYGFKPYSNQTQQGGGSTCTVLTLQMNSSQLVYMTGINDFIPSSIRLIITKLGKMVDQNALVLVRSFLYRSIMWQVYMVYFHVFKLYSTQIYQNGLPLWANLRLQVTMTFHQCFGHIFGNG